MIQSFLDTSPSFLAPGITFVKVLNIWTLTAISMKMQDGAGDIATNVDLEVWDGPSGTGNKVASNSGAIPIALGLFVAAIDKTYYARARVRGTVAATSPWSNDTVITG